MWGGAALTRGCWERGVERWVWGVGKENGNRQSALCVEAGGWRTRTVCTQFSRSLSSPPKDTHFTSAVWLAQRRGGGGGVDGGERVEETIYFPAQEPKRCRCHPTYLQVKYPAPSLVVGIFHRNTGRSPRLHRVKLRWLRYSEYACMHSGFLEGS